MRAAQPILSANLSGSRALNVSIFDSLNLAEQEAMLELLEEGKAKALKN